MKGRSGEGFPKSCASEVGNSSKNWWTPVGMAGCGRRRLAFNLPEQPLTGSGNDRREDTRVRHVLDDRRLSKADGPGRERGRKAGV